MFIKSALIAACIFAAGCIKGVFGLGLPAVSMGLAFMVCTGSLSIGLAWSGHLHLESLGVSVLAIVPAVAGMSVGAQIRRRIQAEVYRKWFLAGLLALGAYDAARAVMQMHSQH